jgi:hypothetical protein
MNYQIIKDEKLLRDFIDWLPELKETEKYYLCLFSRSKYCKDENGVNTMPHIKSDKSQLKRFVSDKKRMFDKIKQLECEIGAYKHNELPVPQQALALYITVNPREMWKASLNSMIKLAQAIRDNNILMNPHQEVMSEIQRTKSKTIYVDFDFDFPLEKKYADSLTRGIKSRILEIVNPEAVHLIRTRGGIHCLVRPELVSDEKRKTFYKHMMEMGETDQAGDQMIPVIGCTQGDYTPHFINF